MARIHVLAGGQCVVHGPVPAGNNAAGVSWKTAIVNSGYGGHTIMPEGNDAGQITTAEKALIASGDLYEIVLTVHIPEGANAGQRAALLDIEIAKASSEEQAKLAKALRYFGATRG